MKQHLLIGTAGHIDHGKTALVGALTGVDTDRLPDEKRRQITIDLGFAPLEIDDYSIGIVDVPGHERFVKNMLAGAAGVDLAMLVIAADDSVKPQTREHLDILKHLRLKTGIIVITKCDLAELDWIELVESEVRELTDGTFLADAPIVRVSAKGGTGLDELRATIAAAAEQVIAGREDRSTGHFRMSVDRVFTIAGHGTVVTGSVASGQVSIGDQLELQPQGTAVRVRGLQSHDASVDQIVRGQRAAINLAGVHYDEISRGQCLVSCDSLRPSKLLTVELELSDQLSRSLKHRSAIRLHIGTASIPGKIALLRETQLEPGSQTYAQLFLSQPVAAIWGQPFVLRSISPVETLGGGRILDPSAVRIKRGSDKVLRVLDKLSADEPLQRAEAAAFLARTRAWQPSDISILAGIDDPAMTLQQLVDQQIVLQLTLSNGDTCYLHRDIASLQIDRISKVLADEHTKTPLRKFVERSRIAQHFRQVPTNLLDALLATMQRDGQLIVVTQGLSQTDWSPQLSESQEKLLSEICSTYQTASFQPPSYDQLASDLGHPKEDIAELADVAVELGRLVRISKELMIDQAAEQQARTLLAIKMGEGVQLSVSQIRDLLGTSRKIAVPFCEHLDAIGLTRRQGDLRGLANSSGMTAR